MSLVAVMRKLTLFDRSKLEDMELCVQISEMYWFRRSYSLAPWLSLGHFPVRKLDFPRRPPFVASRKCPSRNELRDLS